MFNRSELFEKIVFLSKFQEMSKKISYIKREFFIPDDKGLNDGRWVSQKELMAYCRKVGKHGFFKGYAPTIGDDFIFIPPPKPANLVTIQKHYKELYSILLSKESDSYKLTKLKTLFVRYPYIKCSALVTTMTTALNRQFLSERVNYLNQLGYAIDEEILIFFLGQKLITKQKCAQLLLKAGADFKILFEDIYLNFSMLKHYCELFGNDILNRPGDNIDSEFDVPPLFFQMNGAGNDVEQFSKKIESFVGLGADIDKCSKQAGTVLHILIANESKTISTVFVKLCLSLYKKYPKNRFDFTKVDGWGKTVLLMTVLWRNEPTFKAIFANKKTNKVKIGINISDNKGIVPLFYAAALGRAHMFRVLLDQGAFTYLQDKEGRGLDFFLNVADEFVLKLLEEIDVEPKRDANAPQNWLYHIDNGMPPLTTKDSKEKHGRILLCKDNLKLIKGEIVEYAKLHDKVFSPGILVDFITEQIKPVQVSDGRTVLEDIKLGQKEVRKIYIEFLLHRACLFGDYNRVKILIENKCVDPNALDSLGRSALHYTIMPSAFIKCFAKCDNKRIVEDDIAAILAKSRTQIFSFLLENDANPYVKRNNKTIINSLEIMAKNFKAKYSEAEQKMAHTLLICHEKWQNRYHINEENGCKRK